MWYSGLMKYIFSAIYTKENKGYSVLCPELGVASQGNTIEEAEKNIREAVELYIEDIPKKDLELYIRERIDVPTVKVLEVAHA
jgi:predicted RNase H-like HicB family nuclease